MKYLIIVLVVVAVWMVTRGRKTGQSSTRPGRGQDGSSAMVQCSHCGVYLPRTDALVLGEHTFCSEEHRSASRKV